MVEYYAEVKIWQESIIPAEMTITFLEATNEYRNKKDISKIVSERVVRSIFTSFDVDACNRFLNENIAGLIYGIKVSADSIELAKKSISDTYIGSEIIDCCEITQLNQSIIENMAWGPKI